MLTFGDRFRDARNALKLTQDELAELLDVTKSAVSAWENNREAPTFEKLPRISLHLGVSLDMLICGVQPTAWAEDRKYPMGPPPAAWQIADGDSLPKDEVRLLRRYRSMNPRRRKALMTVLDVAEQGD